MHDVIVVGGGVAGLTTASALVASGLNVVVLEARDRIGGRTHTAVLGEAAVDLGAAWIHDPAHNPLMPYLGSIGVDTRSDGMWGHGMRAFSNDGWLPTEQTSSLVASLYNFDPDVAYRALCGSDRLADGISWYCRTQLGSNSKSTLVDSFLTQLPGAGMTGDQSSDISLKGMAAYEGEVSGHNSTITGGYRTLVEQLATGLDIRLSTEVTEVRHTARRVTVATLDQTYEADWAVVTVPLGVLKSGAVRFSPGMSERQTAALSRLRFKSLEKIAITFTERFWGEEISQIAVLNDRNGFVWVHDFSPHTGIPTLVAFYNPAVAVDMITSEAAADAFLVLLETMFGRVPEPLNVAASGWQSDPYSLGAYSFIPVGASAEDMDALAEPLGPRVLFAGEHTYPSYYGTVQAAWLSGRRAAEAILSDA